MSKRRTYLHNAALLTGSGLVLRALGMGFRIVLAAYLGSEGMGLYQLILALYMVFVSFATAGVNVASARLAAQSLARGSGMASRQAEYVKQAQENTDSYIREVAGRSPAQEIADAKALLDAGSISPAEFEKIKTKALS